ncbi:hypothetical protein Tco_0943125 [Tanacetum coccineum]
MDLKMCRPKIMVLEDECILWKARSFDRAGLVDWLRCSDQMVTITVISDHARIVVPHAAGACFPSTKTRFPLTKVARTLPESRDPMYAEMPCKKDVVTFKVLVFDF